MIKSIKRAKIVRRHTRDPRLRRLLGAYILNRKTQAEPVALKWINDYLADRRGQ